MAIPGLHGCCGNNTYIHIYICTYIHLYIYIYIYRHVIINMHVCVDLHGVRPVDKPMVGLIQFSAPGSKELHAEILHYTYDIHDHCLPRDLARLSTGFMALPSHDGLGLRLWCLPRDFFDARLEVEAPG